MIVGWSEVTGPATTVPRYTWQPRGTAGRAAGARTTPGWVVPLGGLHDLPSGPSLSTLTPLLDRIMDVNAALEARVGRPTYFPFYRYGGSQLRTQQAYFVKFPVELFALMPSLAPARLPGGADVDYDVPEDNQPPGTRAPRGQTTRVQDPELRAAIERRSLDVALAYYANIGGHDAKELGKPFDLVVQVAGVERHCEVKGSSMLIDAVELTANEVVHARRCPHSDLIVVDNIRVRRTRRGNLLGEGGSMRVWMDWAPADDALHEKRYAYDLPSGGGI